MLDLKAFSGVRSAVSLALILAALAMGQRPGTHSDGECQSLESSKAEVWLTVRSSRKIINGTVAYRILQINWDVEEVGEEDAIALFDEIPNAAEFLRGNLNPLFIQPPPSTSGSVDTTYSYSRPNISVLARGGCLGLWGAYMRNGTILAKRCLASYPRWIWDNSDKLGDMMLKSLVLPGTHNSGSYTTNDTFDPVTAWVACQDEDVLSQLLYGNRYLDLRVGFYPNTDEVLFVNHDLVRWLPFRTVLDAVQSFVSYSPDPVIVDIHRTPVGFENPLAAQVLLTMIEKKLGSFLLPSSYGQTVTPREMWAAGKTVIVSFGGRGLRAVYPYLWEPIPQAWANAQTILDLRKFIDAEMRRKEHASHLWAAMIELTPSFWDIVIRTDVGTRGLAQRTNPKIRHWLIRRWANHSNIITSDFFFGSDVIDVSIKLNLHRSCLLRGGASSLLDNLIPTSRPASTAFLRSKGSRELVLGSLVAPSMKTPAETLLDKRNFIAEIEALDKEMEEGNATLGPSQGIPTLEDLTTSNEIGAEPVEVSPRAFQDAGPSLREHKAPVSDESQAHEGGIAAKSDSESLGYRKSTPLGTVKINWNELEMKLGNAVSKIQDEISNLIKEGGRSIKLIVKKSVSAFDNVG